MRAWYLIFILIVNCQSTLTEENLYKNKEENVSIKIKEKAFINRDSLIKEAQMYCIKNQMDTGIAILINYKMHSGLKRGYLIRLKTGKILDSFMVSHGCGDSTWGSDKTKESPKFSNEFESHCSSLGKYKLQGRAYSDWGIHIKYLMKGLDKSNSNAYSRTIVLHGWDSVTDVELYPKGTPEGWGCPAVSNTTMTYLDGLLSKKKKPVLMWIYY